MPGAQCTRRSLVRAGESSMRTSIHSGGTGKSPGIPHAMVLTGYGAHSGDEFLLPPWPRGLHGISHPGWAECASARLDTNNGCQDHTL